MAQHIPVEADEKEIERAQVMWHGFTQMMKYTVILTVLTLALLGLVFIDW